MAGDDLAGRLAALSPSQRERLLSRLEERQAEREAAAGGGLAPVPPDGPLTLSFGQQQLWLLEQLAPGLPLYNIAAAVQLDGPLRVAALAAALHGVVGRHAALRTRVVVATAAAAAGGRRQVMAEVAPATDVLRLPRLPQLDLAALPPARRDAETARLQAAEAARPFDLARGPLLRAVLLRLAARRHRLLLTLHHIASDGWSVAILVRELAALYSAGAAPLPPLPVQYPDFAAWQRRRLQGERLAELTAWWRQRLADLPPPLPLPFDRARPAVRSWSGAQRSLALPAAALAAAAELGERHAATPFMTLAAAFATLLLRYGGQTDVVIGAPIAGRALPEVEGLIGYFVNTLVLRFDLAGDPPFAELLARVRETALAAFTHQELPFEWLVEELRPVRDLALTPLFQVAFAVEEEPPPLDPLAGLVLTPLPASTGSAKFDLTLTVERAAPAAPRATRAALPSTAPATPRATAEYALDLFDPVTVDRLLGHFAALLAAAVAAPRCHLSELPLLAAAQRQQLLREWNDTVADDALLPLALQVAAQAQRAPDALAVCDGPFRLSYGELAATAGRLAQWLTARGVGPEARVALCLGRSAAEAAAMLAVLAAGGAFVPLDPADPDDRLAWLVRDCGAGLLLAGGERAAELAAALGAPREPPIDAARAVAAEVVDLDALLLDLRMPRPPHSLPAPVVPFAPLTPPPAALAYVIYTSGSTGEPKGVAVTHGGLAGLVAWQRRLLGIAAGDRTTHLAGPAFDATILEIWPYLAAGAAVEVIDDLTRLQPAVLGERLATAEITHCFLPTPLAETLLAGWQPPPGLPLRSLSIGGDRLRRLPPRPLPFSLVNLYGPTEATVVATAAPLASAGSGRGPASSAGAPGAGPAIPGAAPAPPIGRPIDAMRAYVLDPHLRLAPPGAAGELCIAGRGVARGYLGRPAETAARFVPDPWGESPGERLYRTGDRARQLADGRLEFLGRLDRQVKVRGFRIEPGEVEAAIAADPAVSACAVLLRDDLPGGPGLVAFVAPVRAAAADPGQADPAPAGPDRADPAPLDPVPLDPAPLDPSPAGRGLADRLRAGLARRLPGFAMPALIVALADLPLTPNGKLDRRALALLDLSAPPGDGQAGGHAAAALGGEIAGAGGRSAAGLRGEVEKAIAAVWRAVLSRPAVGRADNFFDLGGHSLLLVEAHGRLRERFPELQILDLFRHPTIADLAAHLLPAPAPPPPPPSPGPAPATAAAATAGPDDRRPPPRGRAAGREIAVIGMAGRFPGAADVQELWRNLMAGVEAIVPLTAADLERAGVPAELWSSPAYVRVAAVVDGIELFDAGFFGVTPREAEAMDPQHRLFLECAWEALENAGYDPSSRRGRVGVYAGAAMSRYFEHVVASAAGAALGDMPAMMGLDKDFLTTRVSYRLGLEGPSIAVQTACSTSLVAVHLACQALLAGECDLALAGGVALRNLYRDGYLHEEGGVLSPDGHCRAFDAAAAGTVPGDGVGLVVLKRLGDAQADGDAIAAVIKGSAINNDGAAKVGYTAPGLPGQVRVLRDALAAAGVDPATVSYVEAHGTGTALGDPIEVAALTEVFGRAGGAAGCALGSVKTNLGHLDCAAGIAGLIKAVLALRHGAIPPSLHFTRPNPRIHFADTPFFVNSAVQPWLGDGVPRRAGVSSFGIGGTNAHVVLEEAPAFAGGAGAAEASAAEPGAAEGAGWQLLQLSARTETALARAAANLAGHLESHPEIGATDLSDVAFTLRTGRRAFEHRRAVVCRDAAAARAALAGGAGAAAPGEDAAWTMSGRAAGEPAVAFLLPGQGAQRVGMAASLYRTRPAFRAELDRVAELLAPHLGRDLRELLFPRQAPEEAARLLARTRFTQPALFAIEYSMAQLWIGWGVLPSALLGHSVGELVAACLSGVFRLEDALYLVALRGRLIDELPEGAMLGVPLPAAELQALLSADLSLAAENAADRSVAAGSAASIAALERRLAARGIDGRRLVTSHAFHSPAMAPAVAPLVQAIGDVPRRPPLIPFVSNLTGNWIRVEEATDPAYWGRQMLQPVRFAAGLRTLAASHPAVLLEAGPGEALSRMARRELRAAGAPAILSTLPEPAPGRQEADPDAAEAHLLRTTARLWLAGAPLDPHGISAHQRRRRVALPTYPFERQRYWLPRPSDSPRATAPSPDATRTGRPRRAPAAERRTDLGDWFYLPSWRRSLPPPPAATAAPPAPGCAAGAGDAVAGELPGGAYLLFGEPPGEPGGSLTAAVAGRLRRAGRQVTLVFPGPALARLENEVFTLRTGEAEDYDALWAALAAAGMKCGTVLHLWNGAGAAAEPLDAELNRGFYSLMALGGALARAADRDPVELWVVSRHLHDVAGGEPVAPERAALLGPCRVIPLELPHVACRSIDLPPLRFAETDGAPHATGNAGAGEAGAAAADETEAGAAEADTAETGAAEADAAGAEADAADMLLAEVAARPGDTVLAYRGRQRWTQDFEPVRLAAAATPRLRPGCVCLVTGGLGGVGQALARWLARGGARLVLVGRSELPPRERWDELLLAAPGRDGAGGGLPLLPPPQGQQLRLARQLRRLRELEEDGAEVLWAAADVADRAALARVRELVHSRFGGLHGVVHAAGLPGGGILQLRRRTDAAAVLAPKVQGTLALAEVFPPEELDFFVLCSSLNSVLGAVGQADYCAANAFLDAFAVARSSGSSRSSRPGSSPARVLSVAWDRWDEAGMAAEAATPFERPPRALPDLPGEAVSHPLFDRRLPEQAGRQTFVTRFGAGRHWMLAEHRIGGTPVLPGTAYLELARAAFALAGDGDVVAGAVAAGCEIRALSFVAPLVVPDGETCDVFTTLRRLGDAWEVRVASRAAGSGWREHALGEVAALAEPLHRPGPALPALSDLLGAMPLAPLDLATLPAVPALPAVSGAGAGTAGAGTAAAGTAAAGLPALPDASAPASPTVEAPPSALRLAFGPRWRGVACAVGGAGGELLARLELPAEFASDLATLALHPALLDLATGFMHAGAGEAEAYLPFSYGGLCLLRPLPALVYSHARRLEDTLDAATLRYAVTLYDAAGEVLLTVDEYAFRRVDPGAFVPAPPAAQDRPAATTAARSGSPAAGASPPGAAAAPDRAGMTSREGVEAFGRILARLTLPQVLVSTRDLRARAAEAAADTGERLLAELAELAELGGEPGGGVPARDRHPRPALAAQFAAPRDAVEERLAEVWQELLGIERIGVNDDFFELGGDSVLGLRIAALARERGFVLSPNELFAHPTIAALARRVQQSPPPAVDGAPHRKDRPGETAGQPPTEKAGIGPDDFPDAEVSPRDLATLLAQMNDTDSTSGG